MGREERKSATVMVAMRVDAAPEDCDTGMGKWGGSRVWMGWWAKAGPLDEDDGATGAVRWGKAEKLVWGCGRHMAAKDPLASCGGFEFRSTWPFFNVLGDTFHEPTTSLCLFHNIF